MNLMAAYGNTRSKVAEWPCKRPWIPSFRYIALPALKAPLQVPETEMPYEEGWVKDGLDITNQRIFESQD
jgi:hypothetical protein